ncbi:D-arabinono-1,4-lactone oxidase [Arsenicicoccus sp. oral taxon 190]|uniref:D-arabinono-1,4-lactone oxidase n=1 Tax=Arsenicicoccus sp. oral taxon 190 TaxID=1658671 RepID=UPI00067A16B0|nr:D-arabinono-1,4-lactone oxidase [Arsenicicoccus sp. oral taxon 190]AKT51238.1 FAD-linked oxidoreductase [Arsenicicoccus sp. oral taxon 190]
MSPWTNWGGNQSCTPESVATPVGTDEVGALLVDAGRRGVAVKPVGAGHSFTGAALTDGVQVSLDAMTGLVAVDRETGRVRVRAGTRLHDLNRLLEAQGLAMANLGDIDQQSVAGALATGTHGTGATLPGLSGLVEALEIVTPDGQVHRCDREQEPDLFHAARVGLGALGIVTEVTLACVPAFRIEAVEAPDSLEGVLREVDRHVGEHDHFEAFWFPHTDRVLTKHNRRLAPGDSSGRALSRWRYLLDDQLLSNGVFEASCRLAARVPATTPAINAVAARALSARTYTDTSYAVFASPRTVRFTESEYAVPRAALPAVLGELDRWIERSRTRVTFPVEIRFAAADDAWLSTGYQRDNAYVAIHQYHRVDITPYVAAFEDIVAAHEGRPHWGKLHRLGPDQLRALYPRYDDFRAVRDRVDPDRVMRNAYLQQVLGD